MHHLAIGDLEAREACDYVSRLTCCNRKLKEIRPYETMTATATGTSKKQ